MRKLKVNLDEEKQQINEDKVKLNVFKNDLKTKQKAIESMRFEYIKTTSQDHMMHFADQAKDLALYNLQRDATHTVASSAANRVKDLYPIGMNGTGPAPPVSHPTSSLLDTVATQNRFDYNSYMKGLNDKLRVVAPQTKKMAGTGFQEFLLKERQQYLSSVANFEGDNCLLGSSQRAM